MALISTSTSRRALWPIVHAIERPKMAVDRCVNEFSACGPTMAMLAELAIQS